MNQKHTNSPNNTVKYALLFHISIPIILLLSATIIFYSTSVRAIRNQRLEYINKCHSYTDENISTNLHNYLSDALNRPITALNTLSLFFNDSNSNSDDFYELRLDLHNHHLIKRVFQDIIIYRTSDGAFVSAVRAGHSIEDTYSKNTLNYADLHELLSISEPESPIFYLTENSRMYYVYPIHSSDNPAVTDSSLNYVGFCAIWLDTDNFFNLDALELKPNGTTLIIDGDNLLYANGRNVLSSEAVFDIVDKFDNPDNKYLYETLFSTNYSFYCTKSEESGLIYLYYEPVATPSEIIFDLSEPASIMYWICVIIIIICFSLALFIRLKNLNTTTSGRAKKDATLSNESYIFKTSFDLLYGNANLSSPDDALCDIIGAQIPYKYTSCILIEPEPYTIMKMSFEQRADFIGDISASLNMHLENTADTYYNIMHYPSNLLTCIINSSSFIPENLAHNILDHLNNIYECTFNVFCTTPTISLSELPRNYAFILDSRKYAHIYSYNNVFTQDTIELYEAADSMIDTGLTKKILDLLTQDYFDELMQYIRNLPTVIRQRGFSYIRVKDHYRIIFTIVNDFCKENQPDYQYKDMPLSNIINQFETIDECSLFLCDEITLLAEAIAAAREATENSVNKKYIDHILEYIDKNIESISLTSTAEHFNISVAHLSRIFKELTGTNFSDYVADKKLQQAAKLLITDRNISIGDIAKNLGYNTPAYFSRKFKERFEVTPAAYRKQHLNDNQ